jgi:anthranilate phosphoribosyltransferase
MDITTLLNKTVEGRDLTQKEAGGFIDLCAQGILTRSQIAAMLASLRTKGETIGEIVGLISGMRKHMTPIARFQESIDTCGTGGDGSHSFNISTTVAFVAAGAGVSVAKHGNRAASSLCGSADVLEKLGVNIMLTPKIAEKVLKKVRVVFLFAQLYHPAVKHIAPVRKELGIRTVFNYLGPFLNPAKVKRQIIGVPNSAIAKTLGLVATHLDYDHLLIVSSKDRLDEISTSAKTSVLEVKKNKIRTFTIAPSQFGIQRSSPEHILGGDALKNAEIMKDILSGKKGPKRDIVLLNGGAAIYVAGIAKSIKEGIHMAEKSIDSGSAMQILQNLINETNRYG